MLGASCFVQDYDEALRQAKEQHRPLLVFFNGSDWSGLGMKMKKEILDTPQFEVGIASHFTCVEVDFPHHALLPEERVQKNCRLQQQFAITQFPALLLVDSNERVIVHLGYCPEDGENCAADLLKLEALDFQLQHDLLRVRDLSPQELYTCYTAAQELQNQQAIEHILSIGMHSNEPGFFLVERYRQLAAAGESAQEIKQTLFHIDPNNRLGYFYQIALIDFQTLAQKTDRLTPEQIIQPLCDYLEQFGREDREHVWRIEMMIAQFYLDNDCWSIALRHAEVAYREAPLERHADMDPLLHYIRNQAAQTACHTQ